MIKRCCLLLFLTSLIIAAAGGVTVRAEDMDFARIVGKWVRPDGGYTLHVRQARADGSVDIGYYNPKEIHIAQADVRLWKGMVMLYIRFDDEGYQGSTYKLFYYAEKDALAGFYYQAVQDRTYEVVFLRQ